MAIRKFKVGTVQTKKDKSGVTVAVGNPQAKDKKYRTHVELTVRDDEGNLLATAKNGYLKVEDPRKREGATAEQLAKIPAFVKNELFLVVDDGT